MISDMNWMKRMLSHNVRMPMSSITGYGELLRQGLLSPEEQQGIISNICDNINYMNDVLKVVLDEAEDGQTAEKVDLAQIIERTASFVQEVARKIPVTISVRTERPQMYAEANSISVMRVLYHLFENALKYLP
ncbi:MAG: HAMP domain-containing histidine kinase, partial [Anaerotignum sp.]|nr:HAMP domain-containing histidine kinase [Anaerotignum sp.]